MGIPAQEKKLIWNWYFGNISLKYHYSFLYRHGSIYLIEAKIDDKEYISFHIAYLLLINFTKGTQGTEYI